MLAACAESAVLSCFLCVCRVRIHTFPLWVWSQIAECPFGLICCTNLLLPFHSVNKFCYLHMCFHPSLHPKTNSHPSTSCIQQNLESSKGCGLKETQRLNLQVFRLVVLYVGTCSCLSVSRRSGAALRYGVGGRCEESQVFKINTRIAPPHFSESYSDR